MRRNNKSKYLIIILLLIVSIGFAFLSSRLDFNGIANVRPINWKIYFDNVQKNFGQEFEITEPSTSGEDTTSINFEVELADPGDSYSFDVDIVNGGSIDAMYKITYDWSTYDDEHPELYIFEVKYKDGMELQENALLKKNSRETITVTVAYNRDIDIESLPTEDRSVNYNLTLEYEQANIKGSKAQEREKQYTITYDLDGGVNNPSNPTTYTNRTETFTLEEPTKEGYTFLGWEDQQDKMSFASRCSADFYDITTENGVFTSFQNKEGNSFNSFWVQICNISTGKYLATIHNSANRVQVNKVYTSTMDTGYYYLNIKGNTNSSDCTYYEKVYLEKDTNYIFKANVKEITPNQIQVENIQFYKEGGSTVNIPVNTFFKGSEGNRTLKALWQAN